MYEVSFGVKVSKNKQKNTLDTLHEIGFVVKFCSKYFSYNLFIYIYS